MATDIINSANLTPQATLQVPTYQPTPVDPSIATSAISSVAGQYESVNKQLEQAQAEQKAQAESQLSLQASLMGKTADTQAFQDQAGVNSETAKLNSYAQTLADLNAQASSLQREAQAIPIANRLQYQQGGVAGTESQVKNVNYDQLQQNALKALSIAQQSDIAGAALTGSQLKLQAAKDKAQQMVDLKYKPLEDQLALKKQQYDLNKDILSQIDKKRTEALNAAIKKEEQQLADQKANEKGVSDLVTNAAGQGAPADLRARAAKAKTPMEAANILGVYAGDYLGNQVKKAQLAKLGLENSKAYKELYDTDPSGLKYLSYEENAKFNSTPEAKSMKDATSYAKAVSDYKAAINKYGTGELFGKGSGELGQAYSALVGATKDYYTLGTLDNGVQKLIALGIPEPSLTGLKSGRIDALDTALNAASDTIKRNADQLLSTRYSKTNELKQLMDNANGVLMYRMSNQDLLNSIPGSNNINTVNTSTNSSFFNK